MTTPSKLNTIYVRNKNFYKYYYKHNDYISFEDQIIANSFFLYLGNCKKNIKVLEVGFGKGLLAKKIIKNLNARYFGYETSASAKKEAKNIVGFRVIENLNAAHNDFDLIILSHVIEHIKYDLKILKILYKKLSVGGRLCMSFPTDALPDVNTLHFRTYNLKKFAKKLSSNFRDSKISYYYLPPSKYLNALRAFITKISFFSLNIIKKIPHMEKKKIYDDKKNSPIIKFIYFRIIVPLLLIFFYIDLIISRYIGGAQGFIDIKKSSSKS
jgi:SAM-dependent methyltransferase